MTSKIKRTQSQRQCSHVMHTIQTNAVRSFRAFEMRKASDAASCLRPVWEAENHASSGCFAFRRQPPSVIVAWETRRHKQEDFLSRNTVNCTDKA